MGIKDGPSGGELDGPLGGSSTVPRPGKTKLPPNGLRVKIPSLLLATNAWIGHRAKKPLVLPDGRKAAKTNLPDTWRSFDDGLKFYAKTHKDPNAGLGFVFQRDQGVTFIDFDHCLTDDGALKSWAAPILAPFQGKTFIERSVSGSGLHVLALGTIVRARPHLVPPGATGDEHIDVYNDLRFVALTGDAFDGAPITLAPMQAEIDAMLAPFDTGPAKETGDGPGWEDLSAAQLEERLEEVTSALSVLDPDMAYEEWLRVGMAVHHGLGDRGLALWDEWSSRGAKYHKGECAQRWSSFHRSGITLGTIFHMARQLDWRSPLDDPKRQFDPIETAPEPERDLNDLPFEEAGFHEWVAMGYQLWKPNPKQEVLVPCFNEANLHRFFTHHEDWGSHLRFNIRSQFPEVDGQTIDTHRSYRALAQSHAHLGWTKRAYSVKTVQAVIQAVAEKQEFDPVAELLRTFEWDGEKRIETLCALLGLEDAPITRRCLTRWLIGAVARAFKPGCRMQNMLLLLGPQGRHKSGFFARLAMKPEWFHESHIDIKGKEGYITLDRKWIVEFAELDGLRKVDIEKVKAFISESVSNYRSPYARVSLDHPRHFVLGGTANEDKILRDPPGARRFWPLRCAGELNVKLLTEQFVQQVWAEARTLFENGVRWWDEGNEVTEINERNAEFFAESISDTMISKTVEEEFATHGALRMKQLVARLLELRVVSPATPENAVASVLRRHGWTDQIMRVDGAVNRFWFSPRVPSDKRKDAAVIVFNEWRRSTGALDPVEEQKP